jgi:hypothetical protein
MTLSPRMGGRDELSGRLYLNQGAEPVQAGRTCRPMPPGPWRERSAAGVNVEAHQRVQATEVAEFRGEGGVGSIERNTRHVCDRLRVTWLECRRMTLVRFERSRPARLQAPSTASAMRESVILAYSAKGCAAPSKKSKISLAGSMPRLLRPGGERGRPYRRTPAGRSRRKPRLRRGPGHRRPAADHSRGEPGTTAHASFLHRAVRCGPRPGLEREDQPTPALPRRRPRGQRGSVPHRTHPDGPRPTHTRVRRPADRCRAHQDRDHPAAQACHRPRGLPAADHPGPGAPCWLEDHPRIRHVFIPVGACWLNLQEGWWHIFRKAALTGQSFAGPPEIEQATRLATGQLNARARPWVRGRPAPSTRVLRRRFVYTVWVIQH